jgi:hypothetical protein
MQMASLATKLGETIKRVSKLSLEVLSAQTTAEQAARDVRQLESVVQTDRELNLRGAAQTLQSVEEILDQMLSCKSVIHAVDDVGLLL